MTVTIRYLNKRGDVPLELTVEEAQEAQELIDAEQGRYFIVDADTRKVLQEIHVKDGQSLVLLPAVGGG